MMSFYAKKSLGQNFLKSAGALSALVDAGDVMADDIILEIGPGLGALTEKLLFFAGKVIAIEKDAELYEILRKKFATEITTGRLDLILGDALEFDTENMCFYADLNYKIIANIPYNITGLLIRKFLSADYKPICMVLVMQKEVVERIAKDKKESILSLAVKYYGTPRYVKTVPRGSFSPVPGVDSAILAVTDIVKRGDKKSEELFFILLHAGFAHKRKKLLNNLAEVLPKEKLSHIFTSLSLVENTRAEDLSLNRWLALVEKCSE